jgi:hypothetical protein
VPWIWWMLNILYKSLVLPVAVLPVAEFFRNETPCLARDWNIRIWRPLPVLIVPHPLWTEQTEGFSFWPWCILGSIVQGAGWWHRAHFKVLICLLISYTANVACSSVKTYCSVLLKSILITETQKDLFCVMRSNQFTSHVYFLTWRHTHFSK